MNTFVSVAGSPPTAPNEYSYSTNPNGTIASEAVASGASLLISASVSVTGSAGDPSGQVDFYDSKTTFSTGTLVGSAQLAPSQVNINVASCTLPVDTLTALGIHVIYAVYDGDSNYAATDNSPANANYNALDVTDTGGIPFMYAAVDSASSTLPTTLSPKTPINGTVAFELDNLIVDADNPDSFGLVQPVPITAGSVQVSVWLSQSATVGDEGLFYELQGPQPVTFPTTAAGAGNNLSVSISGAQVPNIASGNYFVNLEIAGLTHVDTDPNTDTTATITTQEIHGFSVTVAATTPTTGQLAFGKMPGNSTAGDPVQPVVTVKVEDSKGNIDTSDNSTVVTLTPVRVNAGNPITGNTATAVNGIATFSNVVLTKPNFYQLQATDSNGDTAATSGKFKIAGDKLKFLKAPASADVNVAIPVSVELLTSSGKRDTAATSSVVLSLNRITGSSRATLSGTTTAQFVGGLATFTPAAGLKINVPGSFTMTATEEDTTLGALAPTNTSAPLTSSKFNIKGITLKSIIGSIGTQKKTSTDDDLTITNANVFAMPQSNTSMLLTAVGLSPSSAQILQGVGWTLVRNTSDTATGAVPAITQSPANRLQAKVALNGEGSFNVICYYDANGNGAYDAGEELKVFHLAEVAVVLTNTASAAVTSNNNFSVTDTGKTTVIASGTDSTAQYAIQSSATVEVTGGGADGMIGVSQIHLGFLQNAIGDSVVIQYQNGKTLSEKLSGEHFPILDSSYKNSLNLPSAVFELPPNGYASKPAIPGPTRDPVTGTDPAGGQDRSISTADSPQVLKFADEIARSPVASVSGSNDFDTYLSAYSDSYAKTYAAYLQISWSALFNYTQPLGGAWHNNGSTVTASVSNLAGPTLDSLGVATSGTTFDSAVVLK